mmetsp:Transcript_2385/g.3461  ORF Transcript_2385/g.3461 Transcript_2385/m.3461 type:complete len:294 (+) Transcript_2385:2631-3512(+)
MMVLTNHSKIIFGANPKLKAQTQAKRRMVFTDLRKQGEGSGDTVDKPDAVAGGDQVGKKRDRPSNVVGKQGNKVDSKQQGSDDAKKKKKKKRKKGNKETEERALDEMTPEERAQWFTDLYEKCSTDLSMIEKYPKSISDAFKSDYFLADTKKDNLVSVIKSHMKKDTNRVLIVTRSALRACALNKEIAGDLRKPIAKLFAKHMKVEEQKAWLEANPLNIAVGTPNRLLKLAEIGSLDNLFCARTLLVLDLDPDVKKYNLVTMPGVKSDCFEFFRKRWLALPGDARPKVTFLTV